MEFRYDCLSEQYKQPFGCLRLHETCRMTVEVSADTEVRRLEVVLAGESGCGLRVPFSPGEEAGGFVRCHAQFTLPRTDLYFYHFYIDTDQGPCEWYRSGERGVSPGRGDRWQLTCYPDDFQVPEGLAGSVMYQIFPDRFFKGRDCDLTGKLEPYWVHDNWSDTPRFLPDERGEVLNNDFFGGNLDGIRQKLGYLKSLHVEIIYLNPICMAYSNHRYDTADYKRVDPMLGSDEDFAALCREAHALGMKVVLDGVFSHTGSNSVYFDQKGVFGHGACSDPDSPYRGWYDFQHYPDRYTSWWGIVTLPCVHEMNESYLDYIIQGEDSVIAHWLSLGADGFRLDVADELPDAFIAAFRARLKALKPDAILLGEVWEDASNKIAYDVRRRYFADGELDSVMNYPFRNAILGLMAHCDPEEFRRSVMTIVEHYPAPVLHCLMNSLSTHDTPRILTLMGDSFDGPKTEKAERFLSGDARPWASAREMAAAVLQFTLPGMASLYYGDEAGMEGFEDPFNRRGYPWGGEDRELLEFYRQLTELKCTLPALRTGGIQFQPAPDGVVCFVRTLDGRRVRTLVNSWQRTVDIPVSGQVLFLHYGRCQDGCVSLDQWGTAIISEEE
ncbi:MAG: glycoside hydrolase family 13 protein [Candidatus Enterenecus sp.]